MRKTAFRSVLVFGIGMMLTPVARGQWNFSKINNTVPDPSDTVSTDGRIPLGATAGKGDTSSMFGGLAVLKEGDTYIMWYAGTDGTGYRIYRATSSDGLTWNKGNTTVPPNSDTTSTDGRIPLGTAGKGDATGALRPWVIKDGDTYKMWYTGTLTGTNRIYHATSPNGLDWTKYNNEVPASSTSNDYVGTHGRIPTGWTSTRGDYIHAFRPVVIKDGNTYRMWYTGGQLTTFYYRIYRATSSDGLYWQKTDSTVPANSDGVSTNGRIGLASTPGRGDNAGVFLLGVVQEDDVYRLWYSGRQEGGGGNNPISGIYLAISTNEGLTWTKQSNVVATAADTSSPAGWAGGRIGRGATAGRGDTNFLYEGAVIRDDNVYRLWYVGASDGIYRIYSATAPVAHPTVSNVTAVNVGLLTAQLVGHLASTGTATTTLRVFYGTNDARFAWSEWQTNAVLGTSAIGVHTQLVTGLLPNTQYYYRFHGANTFGWDWADSAHTFKTATQGTIFVIK